MPSQQNQAAQATKPSEAFQQTQADQTANPAQQAKTTHAAQQAHPTQAAQQAQSTKPSQAPQQSQPAQRIVSVDIAKAIAIFFIVIGHAGIVFNSNTAPGGMPPSIVHFAFTFHLPVFFIMSGYFFKASQPFTGAFVKKAARGLIVPYIVTAALVVIVATVIAYFSETLSARAEFFRWLGAALYGEGATTPLSLFPVERIGAIWFLLAMFWAQLILVITDKLPGTNIWIVALFLLAWLSASYIWLPWSIQAGFGAALFMRIGIEMRNHDVLAKNRITWPIALVCFAAWMAYFLLCPHNPSYAMLILPAGLIDPLGGIVATIAIVKISELIGKGWQSLSRGMQAVGRNTLAIFTLHLLEDNVVPWYLVTPVLSDVFGAFAWVVFVLLRFATIAALMGIAFIIPPLRKVYFPRTKLAIFK